MDSSNKEQQGTRAASSPGVAVGQAGRWKQERKMSLVQDVGALSPSGSALACTRCTISIHPSQHSCAAFMLSY